MSSMCQHFTYKHVYGIPLHHSACVGAESLLPRFQQAIFSLLLSLLWGIFRRGFLFLHHSEGGRVFEGLQQLRPHVEALTVGEGEGHAAADKGDTKYYYYYIYTVITI